MKALVILVLLLEGLLHSNLSIGQSKPKPALYEPKIYQAVPLSAKLKECVAAIEQANYFAYTRVNGFGSEYRVFLSFLALDSLAKDKELLFLTQHTHPIVRCYAEEQASALTISI